MNLKPTIRCRTFKAWLNHMNTEEEYKSPKERRKKDREKQHELFKGNK